MYIKSSFFSSNGNRDVMIIVVGIESEFNLEQGCLHFT